MMDIFISNKNKTILKSLIEKSISDKLSINIYDKINENIIHNYIEKKIRILQHNIKNQNDVINFNKQIIINFIEDFSKLIKKDKHNQLPQNTSKQIPQQLQQSQDNKLISIDVKKEQEKPDHFNEKLKQLQSDRDIIYNNDHTEYSYDNLESFSSNNFQFNSLEQFNNDNNTDYNTDYNINYDTSFEKSQPELQQIQLQQLQQQPQQIQQQPQIQQPQQIQQPPQIQQQTQIQQQPQIQQPQIQSQQSQQSQFILDKELNNINIIINSRDRNWRENIDRFKFNITTQEKDIKVVKIPVYENSQIIPNKNYDLVNDSGWIDNDGNSHKKYDKENDFGNVLFEYEKIIDTDKQIIITNMNNIKKIIIEKIIIHKNEINDLNTFIYINIPQINNSKLLLIKEKEIDDYIYYTNNNIINIPYKIDKFTFELFNYDNTYIGNNNKDFYKILNINYDNSMLNITINGNIPNHFINKHFISFNNLNTDDVKINIFCKKLSTTYHKILGISDNMIIIHYEDNNIQIFNKDISGYIFIETLQNIIFLKVE